MKVEAPKSRPFVPYVPPKQYMEQHARAMEYQRIKGFTDTHRTLVVTCEVSATQSFTVGK